MVNGTSLRRLATAPVAAPRVNPTRLRKSPVFSINTGVSAAPAAAPKRVSTTPDTESQANAGTSDFRQLFSGYPANPALSLITTPPFVPVFRTATITDGVQVWGLNHTYFATRETAQWIANQYGTGQIVEVPFGGNGGPYSASATEYHIKLPDGRLVNAGILAGYYERNPEALFPGLADKLIRAQLAG